MPNTKITDLTDGDPAQSGDEIPVNRGGLDRKITAGSIAALASASDDQTAAEVPFTPAGTIAATDVQAAIAELDSELNARIGTVGDALFLTPAEGNAAYQPLDGDLTSWAGVTRAAGFDTFAATPTQANFLSLVTGETFAFTDASNTFTFGQVISTANPFLGLIDTDTGADNFIGANNTSGSLYFFADYNNEVASSTIGWSIDSGSDAATMLLTPTVLRPAANDGLQLGVSGTAWADLFLASGAVVNFDSGDVTVTHSANTLTITGGVTALDDLSTINGKAFHPTDNALDELIGWDDSASQVKNFAVADIATEGVPAAGDWVLIYGAEGDLRKVDWDDLPGAGGGFSQPEAVDDGSLFVSTEGTNPIILAVESQADAVDYVTLTNGIDDDNWPSLIINGPTEEVGLRVVGKGSAVLSLVSDVSINDEKIDINVGSGFANFSVDSGDVKFTVSAVEGTGASLEGEGGDFNFTTTGADSVNFNTDTEGTGGTRWTIDGATGALLQAGTTEYIQLNEITAPANGGTDTVRLFSRDNGAGKTQLCCIFPTGAVQVIATEP